MAENTNTNIINLMDGGSVTLPTSSAPQTYRLAPNAEINLDFDLSTAVFTSNENNLIIMVENADGSASTIVFEDYLLYKVDDTFPTFKLIDGEAVPGNVYLFAFDEMNTNSENELETAAGANASGSGAGSYTDDEGNLYRSLNGLRGQDDPDNNDDVTFATGIQPTAATAATATATPPTFTGALELNGIEDGVVRILDTDIIALVEDPDPGTFIAVTDVSVDGGTLSKIGLGVWLFTPDPDANGPFTVEYTVTDGTFTVDSSGTIDIAPVNDDPTTGVVTDKTMTEDGTITITSEELLANADDVDFTTPGALDKLVVSSVSAPNGTMIETSPGVWTFTPDANYNGEVTYSFTVEDGQGGSATGEGNITVVAVNDTAEISGKDDAQLTESLRDITHTRGGRLFAEDIDSPETFNGRVTTDNNLIGGVVQDTIGSLTINENGRWTYNVENSDIAYLGKGDSLTETFTVYSEDGTPHDIVITINGRNNAAVIEATVDSPVYEDGEELTGVTFSVSDLDQGQGALDGTEFSGTYGKISQNADGSWTYDLDNDNRTVQRLSENEELTDYVKVYSDDGTMTKVAVTIIGSNDVPTMSGNGRVIYEEADTVVSGRVAVRDTDQGENLIQFTPNDEGVQTFESQYGTFTLLDNKGNWTFEVNNAAVQFLGAASTNAPEGLSSLTDSITVTSLDGSATHEISVTIRGENDAAAITHTSVREAIADGTTATGTFSVTDIDRGEEYIKDMTFTGKYGSLTVDNDSDTWEYTLNPNKADIKALGEGDRTTDTVTVVSLDGTTHQIEVNIVGVNDEARIWGTSSASVKEDRNVDEFGNLNTGGTLKIHDVDTDESSFIDQDYFNGLGTLDMNADGTWTYSVANDLLDSLPAGYRTSETFTIYSFDNTEHTITINFTGTNDGAVITPSTTTVTVNAVESNDPSVTEIIGSGKLDVADVDVHPVDGSEAFFQAMQGENGVTKKYGTFEIDALGNWTYTVDNTLTAVQRLGENDQLFETFTVKSIDGTSYNVKVYIDGTNDEPLFGGSATRELTEDFKVNDENNLVAKGDLSINDPDQGQNYFQAGTYTEEGNEGTLVLQANGKWTYTVSNEAAAIQGLSPDTDDLVETFTVKAMDGTPTTISVTINGTEDAPEITGKSTGDVIENSSISTGGKLTATDADSNDTPLFIEETNLGGKFGSLEIDSLGNWTYTLDDRANALAAGEDATETFTVTAATGDAGETVEQVITIDVTGTNDAPTLAVNSPITIDEGGTYVFTSSDLQATDVDLADGEMLTYRMDGLPAGGDVYVNGVKIGDNGTFTQEDIDNGLVEYRQSGSEDNSDLIRVQVSDGQGGISAMGTLKININDVNEAPVIDLDATGTQQLDVRISGSASHHNILGVYTLDENGNPSAPKLLLADSRDFSGNDATLLEDTFDQSDQIRFFVIPNGAANDFDATGETMSFDTSGEFPTITIGDKTFNTVFFTDSELNRDGIDHFKETDNQDGTISIQVEDLTYGGDRNFIDLEITLTKNPDGESGLTIGFTEGDGPTAIIPASADLSITDVDSQQMSKAEISLTPVQDSDILILTDTLPDGIAIDPAQSQLSADGSGYITITLVGDASADAYESALQLIKFNNNSDNPGTADRTIDITVTDKDGNPITSDAARVTVTMEAVNDVPTTSPVDESMAEEGTITFSDADLIGKYVTDVDNPEDLNITEVRINGVLLEKNDDGDWEYTAPKDLTGTQDITFKVSDQTDGSNPQDGAGTLTITNVNDAPELTADSDLTGEIIEDGAAISGTIEVIDVDEGETPTFTETSFTGTYGDLTINTESNEWTYTLHADAEPPLDGVQETFNITGTSGPDSFSYPITIDVTGTNDNPELTASSGATFIEAANDNGEGQPVSILDQGSISISDVDTPIDNVTVTLAGNVAGDELVMPTLKYDADTNTYNYGDFTLTLTGNTVTITDVNGGNITDFDALEDAVGQIMFSNSSQTPADGDRTVTITVEDTEGGTDSTDITIGVTPVNDAPVSETFTETASSFDSPIAINFDPHVSDVEDDASATDADVTSILIESLPIGGTLYYTNENGVKTAVDEDDLGSTEFALDALTYEADDSGPSGILLGSRDTDGVSLDNWGVALNDSTRELTLDNGVTVTTKSLNGELYQYDGSNPAGTVKPHIGHGIADATGEGLNDGQVLTMDFNGAKVSHAEIGFDGMAGHFDPGSAQDAHATWEAWDGDTLIASGSINNNGGDIFESMTIDQTMLGGAQFDRLVFSTSSNSSASNWELRYVDVEFGQTDSFTYTPIDSDNLEGNTSTVNLSILPDALTNEAPVATADEFGTVTTTPGFTYEVDTVGTVINPDGMAAAWKTAGVEVNVYKGRADHSPTWNNPSGDKLTLSTKSVDADGGGADYSGLGIDYGTHDIDSGEIDGLKVGPDTGDKNVSEVMVVSFKDGAGMDSVDIELGALFDGTLEGARYDIGYNESAQIAVYTGPDDNEQHPTLLGTVTVYGTSDGLANVHIDASDFGDSGALITQLALMPLENGAPKNSGNQSDFLLKAVTASKEGSVEATYLEDQPIQLNAADLLANDKDTDGDTLSIHSVSDLLDENGNAIGGHVALNDDGTITFQPDADFSGQAKFTYTVTDGVNISEPATVTLNIHPVGEAPTLDLGDGEQVEVVSENAGYTNMLGIYFIENGEPTDPEIILTDSNNSNMLQNVLETFQGDQDVHFFLLPDAGGQGVTQADALLPLSFVKDGGNWALGMGTNQPVEVRFDLAELNPDNEETFRFSTDGDTTTVTVDDQTDAIPKDDDDFDDMVFTVTSIEDGTANYATGFTEGGTAVSIAGDVDIADADSTQLSKATIVLANAKAGDALNIPTLPAGMTAQTVQQANGAITVTLSGTLPLAMYQDAIQAITFENTEETMDVTDRVIEIKVFDDGGTASNAATTTISMVSSPVAPEVDNNGDDGMTPPSNVGDDLDWKHNVYAGDDNDNTIFAQGGKDEVYGLGGNDTIDGQDHADTLYGGTGDDNLIGNQGKDVLHGGAGDDILAGGDNSDLLYGGADNDLLTGINGNDTFYGGSGNDTIDGGDNNDVLYGGSGNDSMIGGQNNDLLVGGSGNDTMSGDGNNDTLIGGDGNDLLVGGAGNDLFIVGVGDTVEAGSSADDDWGHDTIFIDQSVLADGGGEIVVKDFNVNTDTLELGEGLSISDVIVGDENGDTQLVLSNENPGAGDDVIVKLLGVSRTDFGQGDDQPLISTDNTTDTLIDMMINSAGDDNG